MSIDASSLTYVPTVFLKVAELAALSNLPEVDKDDLTPIFLLRPWMSSHQLMASIDKIVDSIGSREFYLDLDPFFTETLKNSKRDATKDFIKLRLSENSYENWYDFVREIPNATPCLQLGSLANRNIPHQIAKATEIGRGFLAYIRYELTPNPEEVVEQVCKTDHADFAFVLDLLWSERLDERMEWASSLVRLASHLRPEIRIITTGSSFPASFTRFSIGETAEIKERSIFQRLKQDHNAAKLIYGDWGSTRGPMTGGGGADIPPRIDFPSSNGWAIYRITEGENRFQTAARHIVHRDDWDPKLAIWGKYLIENTANDIHPRIDNLKKASAARINMHLHSQLRYDMPALYYETEDDYVD